MTSLNIHEVCSAAGRAVENVLREDDEKALLLFAELYCDGGNY